MIIITCKWIKVDKGLSRSSWCWLSSFQKCVSLLTCTLFFFFFKGRCTIFKVWPRLLDKMFSYSLNKIHCFEQEIRPDIFKSPFQPKSVIPWCKGWLLWQTEKGTGCLVVVLVVPLLFGGMEGHRSRKEIVSCIH